MVEIEELLEEYYRAPTKSIAVEARNEGLPHRGVPREDLIQSLVAHYFPPEPKKLPKKQPKKQSREKTTMKRYMVRIGPLKPYEVKAATEAEALSIYMKTSGILGYKNHSAVIEEVLEDVPDLAEEEPEEESEEEVILEEEVVLEEE